MVNRFDVSNFGSDSEFDRRGTSVIMFTIKHTNLGMAFALMLTSCPRKPDHEFFSRGL
jgi:hypothetical protein